MKQLAFSVYDKKAQSYGRVFFAGHPAEASRALATDMEKNPDSLVAKYAPDFSLVQVGSFDPMTGVICDESGPQTVVECVSLTKNPVGALLNSKKRKSSLSRVK